MMPWQHRRLAAWIACLAIVLETFVPALAPAIAGALARDAEAAMLAGATCSASPAGHALPSLADTLPGQPQRPAGSTGAHCPWCPWPPAQPGLASAFVAGAVLALAPFTVPHATAHAARQRTDGWSPANPRAPPLAA
ncbi:MAG: DUF2946 domain-containing protein [Burkholderiales bacterium]|nr:DUF2946 domain-containing protein [Burkholderiales bacterium]OJX00845.1 MAG: hypothetical protein BGO72_05575 [Burkholderiales bacterium 70-64]